MAPPAYPRAYSRSPSPRPRSPSPLPRGCTIVVERLTKNVTIDHLEEIFDHYGRVEEVALPINKKLGTHKGTAYITYRVPKHAQQAIDSFDQGQIDGSKQGKVLLSLEITLTCQARRASGGQEEEFEQEPESWSEAERESDEEEPESWSCAEGQWRRARWGRWGEERAGAQGKVNVEVSVVC